MTSTILVKPCGIGNFEWLGPDATADDALAVGDLERLASENQDVPVTMVVPAEQVGLRTSLFDDSERKLLRQTLPYSLEEELIEDVDDLHFALAEAVGNEVGVAVIKREQLEDWQALVADEDVDLQGVVSELQLLPWVEGSWTVFIDEDRWLVRTRMHEGFALPSDTAKIAMELLVADEQQWPESIALYATAEDQPSFMPLLPEQLQEKVQVSSDNFWQIVLHNQSQNESAINLLQGEFAPSLPWKKWWGRWRLIAIVLASAVVLNILFLIAQVQILDSKNLALRGEIEQVYRSVVPRGAVMDPVKQLKRKMAATSGGSGPGFVSLLETVAKVLTTAGGIEIQSINYTEKQAEIRPHDYRCKF